MDKANAGHVWRDLFEQFGPFDCGSFREKCKAGDVAARTRQTRDEAGPNRIVDLREHDRNGAGLAMQRRQGRGITGKDHVRFPCDEFRRAGLKRIGDLRDEAEVKPYVATDKPSMALQAIVDHGDAGRHLRIAFW